MSRPQFFSHLAAFRGLAIITIVAAHSWSFSLFWTGGLNGPWLPELFWTTEVLFHGSTLYFAVLSGLLYSLVLHQKTWPSFFKGKLFNVVMPYIVVSIAVTAMFWPWTEQGTTESSFFIVTGINLLTGNAMIHFWYMLMLAFLFVITPLLALCMRHPRYHWFLIVLALLPMFISRSPFPDFLKPQSFVYFTGAYAFGILWGVFYHQWQDKLAKWRPALLLLTASASIGLWFTYYSNMPQEGLFSVRQSLVYVQKLAIMLIVVPWLANKSQPRWLLSLGEYAFAIYFLHVLFIAQILIPLNEWLSEHRDPLIIGGIGLSNLVVGVTGAFIAAWMIRRLVGKRSRMLIGV